MILRLLLITMSIPLSAMAGEFSRLTPVQEAFILAGHHCCYSDEVVDLVLTKNQTYHIPKYNFDVPIYVPQNYWEEPVDRWMWALFWGIHLADIYSTHEGVKWDCISEANPLLPSIPTIAEMAILKRRCIITYLWSNRIRKHHQRRIICSYAVRWFCCTQQYQTYQKGRKTL